MPEILKPDEWIPLSKLPSKSDLEFSPSDYLRGVFDAVQNNDEAPEELKQIFNLFGQAIPEMPKVVDHMVFNEYPIIMGNMRFPHNINTGESLVDLDRIMVNRKLMRALNGMACFTGSILSGFSGGGGGRV